MSYSLPAFRPQIYSYQSRSRFRQYPRQVVTSIPGAGYAVKNLVWGDQAIDLSGLGAVEPYENLRWWESTPAFWARATPLGWDDHPQLDQIEAGGGPVFVTWRMNNGEPEQWVVGKAGSGGGFVPPAKQAAARRMITALKALNLPTLSTAEVEARVRPNRTSLYVGIGLGAAALLGGGYYLMKRGKKAA